jgi:hypothetical protein
MSTFSDQQASNESTAMKTQEPNEEEISRLLRFKKYELPPPGFHEDFLQEFQRRQRIESMRPNWWERFREAAEELMDRVRVPSYAYATVGLFAVATGAWILSSEEIGSGAELAANVQTANPAAQEFRLDLSSEPPTALPNPVNIPQKQFVGTLPPRYLLQSRPTAESDPFRF